MGKWVAWALALVVALTACSAGDSGDSEDDSAGGSSTEPSPSPSASAGSDPAEPTGVPRLRVREVATGLDHPWEVRPVGAGRLLFTQRDRAVLSLWTPGDGVRELAFGPGAIGERIWVSGETGLMGLELDPGFDRNRRIYTCSGWTEGDRTDVRINAWTVDAGLTRATHAGTVLAGLPATSGRHGGCRLLIARDGSMYVGTGDAAVGSNPRDLTSLGGKVLRLDPRTGDPWPDNPWADAEDPNQRYVASYGHRNVQGLTQRANGQLWTVEQGTWRDDEVNRHRPGGDYGYHPVPGYNEEVPMTDHDLPGPQVGAAWSSGEPTLATSGGGFLPSAGWGAYDGALAVAAQKAERLLVLTLDGTSVTDVHEPPALQRYGRLRTAVAAPDGSLLVLTDNGDDDAILRVSPRF